MQGAVACTFQTHAFITRELLARLFGQQEVTVGAQRLVQSFHRHQRETRIRQRIPLLAANHDALGAIDVRTYCLHFTGQHVRKRSDYLAMSQQDFTLAQWKYAKCGGQLGRQEVGNLIFGLSGHTCCRRDINLNAKAATGSVSRGGKVQPEKAERRRANYLLTGDSGETRKAVISAIFSGVRMPW